MAEKLKYNPFAQLFPSLEDAENYSKLCKANFKKKQESKMPQNVRRSETIPNEHLNLNDKIERLFGITLDMKSKNQAVYLADVASSAKQAWLDLEILEQALFERLLIEDPTKALLNQNSQISSPFVVERSALIYLYQCYEGIVHLLNSGGANKPDDLKKMVQLILRNIATALKQPVLYSSQNIFEQFSEILPNAQANFMNELVIEIKKDEEDGIAETIFGPFLEYIFSRLSAATLGAPFVKDMAACLLQLAGNEITADILIEYSTPKNPASGEDFQKTLFGTFLGLSCLPKYENFDFYDYYLKNVALSGNYERPTEEIWSIVADNNRSLHQIFNALLRVSPKTNRKLVAWITDCLKDNARLGKLWRGHGPRQYSGQSVSVGFMINLGAVLLQLCKPILEDKSDLKILKIDPTYSSTGIFQGETCLIPAEKPPTAEKYNFVTEIFFLTHKAIDLGFRVGYELFIEAAQDMSTLDYARRDATRTGFGEAAEASAESLTRQATIMRSYYAAILEPHARELVIKLNVATSKWIIQVILDVGQPERNSYQITEKRKLVFPLSEDAPLTLACIPEFMVTNINWHLALLRKMKEKCLELSSFDVMAPVVTMIIVLTRGKKHVKNPHLRAGLVACLESLVPERGEDAGFTNSKIFEEHPHVNEIIPSLLDVFISIEMTGESVQFEQKFKYRQPIYVLIELLWSLEVHRNRFKELAAEAEANMEAVEPPIFLRFLNLLINDAVFLLDEALSNMAQLKTMELARESEEYLKKSLRDRQQDDALFRHTRLIARFDNILGKWTIKTLLFLTTEIKSIFSHSVLVDRIASMLNYFLHNFVGPNKKNLTVKDKKEYEFNPGETVLMISQIYANLAVGDGFCLAISRDGRSYNPRLFSDAEHVLCRIGGSYLVPEIREVANRVAKMVTKQKRHDELVADAPEEFFDPIMSTLMTDPVILPVSHVTVDRATIARHLLSDQTDPFNRSPLTMDMVQPNVELRDKIETWMATRLKSDE